ncbi:2OG-Fe(II) oxygenase [Tahibacter amnicola]|uniref:2OG-Fe(II) oxygenase n=1 Tax=Tahibacter amnicola TaxID=2976241 RepID=A0ABY6BCE8_9GAMM|nr:2OG-Fe(II) oxygenase [Tahibacter amnicola]UXI67222.1 2OG-Fe(II) oxygenase [Tahibacter amnicola]
MSADQPHIDISPPISRAEAVAVALERHGWCCYPDFIDPATVMALAAECQELDRRGNLRPATTGRAPGRHAGVLRGDRTHWFEAPALSDAQRVLWGRLQALRHVLNRRLMLGLEELEAHYALYPPGAGYARHFDRFRDDDARVVSSVIYLNHDWKSDDGGALRLHLPDGPYDIAPRGGMLVMFLSAEIEHEVLPALRNRLSVAGWFRRRSLT